MAYSPIDKPNTQMNPVLYAGNGGTQSITGVGFQPDFVWYKCRSFAYNHGLFDVVRGASNFIQSNSTDAEQVTSGVTAFDSDGFSVGSDAGGNASGQTYVGWNWKAGGTASSNTDGSITSSVSANTTNGFSVVTWTGTGANATIGHGGIGTPKLIFVKATSRVDSWRVYSESIGNTKYLVLNETGASATNSTEWNNTSPTSSVFTVGSSGNVNRSAETFIAYCFAEKKGFSKFGSYVGNGSTDGTFIYTGFKPAFLLLKRTNAASQWRMYDNKRDTDNVVNHLLYPNGGDAEAFPSTACDFLSNGIKVRDSAGDINASGGTYIYMAFAENPLVASNYVPTTAR